MIEVVYQHKDVWVEPDEPSFFVTFNTDGGADLHFRQGNRPFIAILNADELKQLAASINEHKE